MRMSILAGGRQLCIFDQFCETSPVLRLILTQLKKCWKRWKVLLRSSWAKKEPYSRQISRF